MTSSKMFFGFIVGFVLASQTNMLHAAGPASPGGDSAGNGTGNLTKVIEVNKSACSGKPCQDDPLRPWHDAFEKAQPIDFGSLPKDVLLVSKNTSNPNYPYGVIQFSKFGVYRKIEMVALLLNYLKVSDRDALESCKPNTNSDDSICKKYLQSIHYKEIVHQTAKDSQQSYLNGPVYRKDSDFFAILKGEISIYQYTFTYTFRQEKSTLIIRREIEGQGSKWTDYFLADLQADKVEETH